MDYFGPWEVKVDGRKVELNALTCVDTASNLVKLIRINNETARHIHDMFVQCWNVTVSNQYVVYITREADSIINSFEWLLEMFSSKDV
eukprot:CCRYP_008388-RA/>CCRYP_008388-RA protein AED:0.40 eAED:0.40 QI:0/-1/0/1/-1/1/1/0/87